MIIANFYGQAFILREDSGNTKCMPMPMACRKEMLADWIGAGRAIYGENADTKKWYLQNREKIMLNGEARRWIEEKLGVKNGE